MKVAFVKQKYDVFGPWRTILWKDGASNELLKWWPSKATYWQAACILKADWYIISDPAIKGDYIRGALKDKQRKEIVDRYVKNVISQKEIPYEDYDVVISIDPILKIPKNSKTLFAYYCQEHWDRIYVKSLKKPLNGYDLALAHMLDGSSELSFLPCSISFPYLYSSEVTHSVFSCEKKEIAWIDWRTLTALAETDSWGIEAEKAGKRLENLLGFPLYYKGDFNKTPLGISDPPLWGDAASYLKEMSKCKYYIGVGRRGGAGQALGDAASLGCICIGEKSHPYHKLICHPQLLCKDLFNLPDVFKKVVNSPVLQKEALEYQNRALKEKFEKEPLELLKKAIRIKLNFL